MRADLSIENPTAAVHVFGRDRHFELVPVNI
jgi:hypothetical protein